MRDKSNEKEVEESFYFKKGKDPEMMNRVIMTWDKIHVKDDASFGKKYAIIT